MNPQTHGQQLLESLYRRLRQRQSLRARTWTSLLGAWELEPLPPRRLFAVTPVGGETPVNASGTAGVQANADVAVNSSGNVAYVWANSGALASDAEPAVAIRSDGKYVIAWQQTGDIYAQQFNADGSAAGAAFVVNNVTTGTQQRPDIAMRPTGEFLITWDGSGTGDTDGIFARRYNANATAAAAQFLVNISATTGVQSDPSVAVNDDGSFLITFTDDDSGGRLAGNYFNTSFVQQGVFDIETSGSPHHSSIATDGSGNFVVAYTMQDSGDQVIKYRRYSAGSAVDGNGVSVEATDQVDVTQTSVAMDSSGNFIVAWDASGRDGSGWGVYARRFLASGSADGAAFRVNTTTAGDQLAPNVTITPTGDAVVVWSGNGNGDADGIFSQQYSTAGGGGGGSPNVAPVNSVPSTQTIAEDTGLTFSSANGNAISISDTDAGSSAVRVTLSVTNGVLTLLSTTGLTFTGGDGVADASMTFTGTISAINAALNGLGFTPTGNFNGTATLSLTTNDQGNTGTGGALSDTDSVSINVTAVNDAPVNGLPSQQSVSGGGFINFGGGSGTPFSVYDVDAGSSPLKVSLTASVGTLTLGSTTGLTFSVGDGNADATMTFTGSQSAINAALDGMEYTPPFLLLSNPTISITTDDQGATGSGGAQSDDDTLSLNAIISNQPPVLTLPSSQTMNEDANLVLSSGGGNVISVADPDAGSGTLEVTLTGSNGKLTLAGTSGLTFTTGDGNADATIVFTATLSDINNALNGLIFTPNPNFNGAASVQISVDDQGNSGGGGAKSDSGTVGVTVNAINDAPTLTAPTGGTLNEDSSLVFSSANANAISIADVDAAGSLLELTLTSTGGKMTFSGTTGLSFVTGDGLNDTTIVVRGTVANLNAALNGMAFVPDQNLAGPAGINVSIDDLGNNGTGGSLGDNATIELTINALNDAPVNTVPSAQNISEDALLTFSTANANAISIGDVDSDAGHLLEVTLSASNGTLTLSGSSGLSFSAGDGASDAMMTFTGTLANINAALNGLIFTPTADFNGSASVEITTSDQGHSGAGGAKSDSDSISVAVSAVNDPPVNTVPGAITIDEDSTLTLSPGNGNAIAISDVDASVLRVTLESTDGILSLGSYWGLTFIVGDGSANDTMTFEGSLSFVALALDGVVFQPNEHFHGVTSIKVTTTDLGQTGAGGAKSDVDVIPVTVTSLNDAPVVNMPVAQSIVHSSTLTFGTARGNRVWIDDVDADGNAVRITLSVGVGSLTLATTAGLSFTTGDGTADATMQFTGTVAAINTALDGMIFAAPSSHLGTTNLQLSVNDQANSGAGGAKTASGSVAIEMVSEFRANTSLANTQQLPALAMNANGKYVVAWTSNHGAPGNYGIYAQRYDESGNPIGGEIHINTTTLSQQTNPGIAIDDAGNFVVTWSSNGQDGSGWGIYARKFNAYGTALTGEIAINQTTTGDQTESTIASTPDGKFIVTWTSDPGGTTRADVYARLFNTNGTPAGNEFRVNTNLTDYQYQPVIAVDRNGKFVIAWRSNRQDGSGAGVFARRFDATGTALSAEFQVNQFASGNQDKPSVSMAGTGAFVVAWASGNAQDGDGRGIFARLYNANGAAVTNEFQVNSVTANNQDYPSVAMDALGLFTVSWSSNMQDGSGRGIYARQYDAAGTPITGEFRVSGTTIGAQDQPSTGMSASGSMAIVWHGAGFGDQVGVFGQFYRTANAVPSAQSTNEDTALIFASSRGNAISVIGRSTLLVTLSVTHGTLTLASIAGLTFITGDGSSDSSLSFEGSAAAINLALEGMRFDPTPNYFGPAQLNIMTSSIVDDALSDMDTVAITVNSINDAPTLSTTPGPTIDAGQTFVVTNAMLHLTDVDNTSAELIYTVSSIPVGGVLKRNDQVLVVGESFTQADIDAGLVTYTQSGAQTSDSFVVTASDVGGATGGNATVGIGINQPTPPPPTPNPNPTPEPTPQTPVSLPPVVIPPITPGNDEIAVEDTEVEPGGGGGDGASEESVTIPQATIGSSGGSTGTSTSANAAAQQQQAVPTDQPAAPAQAAPVEQAQAPVVPPPLNDRTEAGGIAPFVAEAPVATAAPAPIASESIIPAVPPPPPAQPVAFIAQPDGVMAEKLDQIQEQIKEEATSLRLAAGTASFVSLGLSVVYILWTIRAGYLLASLLSAMPAWSYVDPLPILDSFNPDPNKKRNGEDGDDDGDSLQSLVNQSTPDSLPEVTS